MIAPINSQVGSVPVNYKLSSDMLKKNLNIQILLRIQAKRYVKMVGQENNQIQKRRESFYDILIKINLIPTIYGRERERERYGQMDSGPLDTTFDGKLVFHVSTRMRITFVMLIIGNITFPQ
jgi:hypothetical protein